MYVVWFCVGLMCTNFAPTKYEYSSLTRCIAKGYQLRMSSGYGWYVKTQCRLKPYKISWTNEMCPTRRTCCPKNYSECYCC